VVIRRPHKNNFTIIDNLAIQDDTISLKATGLLCYFLSLPDDWQISVRAMSRSKTDGRNAINTAMNELEEHGYIRRYHETIMDGSNLSESGKDMGHIVHCCDVTEKPGDWGSSSNSTNSTEGQRKTRNTGNPFDGKPDHNKVLSKQSTISKKDRVPHAHPHASDVDSNIKPMSLASATLLENLMEEREVPEELRDLIIKAQADGDIPQIIGSALIKKIKDMPKIKTDDGMVSAKLWNTTENWIERIDRKTFDWVRDTLIEHNKTMSVRPVVFNLNGRDTMIVSIEEFRPEGDTKKRLPYDTGRDRRPAHDTVQPTIAELAELMTVAT